MPLRSAPPWPDLPSCTASSMASRALQHRFQNAANLVTTASMLKQTDLAADHRIPRGHTARMSVLLSIIFPAGSFWRCTERAGIPRDLQWLRENARRSFICLLESWIIPSLSKLLFYYLLGQLRSLSMHVMMQGCVWTPGLCMAREAARTLLLSYLSMEEVLWHLHSRWASLTAGWQLLLHPFPTASPKPLSLQNQPFLECHSCKIWTLPVAGE